MMGQSFKNQLLKFISLVLLLYPFSIPCYAQNREALIELISNLSQTPELTQNTRLLESLYRSYRFESPTRPASLPITQAPYLPFLFTQGLSEEITQEYIKAYKKNYCEKYSANFNENYEKEVTLVKIFDGFLIHMQSFLDLPESEQKQRAQNPKDKIAETALRLGKNCLSKIITAGFITLTETSPPQKCVTDGPFNELTEKILAGCIYVNKKTQPPLELCKMRQALFQKAKNDLQTEKDSKSEEIVAEFTKQFNQEYAKTFNATFNLEFSQTATTKLNKEFASAKTLLMQKASGQTKAQPKLLWPEMWSTRFDLLENKNGKINLGEFGDALTIDSGMAYLLASQKNSQLFEMASLALYAAVNRLLIVMGGDEVRFFSNRFRLTNLPQNLPPLDCLSKSNFLQIPPIRFQTQPFGGWGLNLKPNGLMQASPWDYAKYSPSEKPGSYQIFPSELTVNPRGIPEIEKNETPIQKLSDLTQLLRGTTFFLKLTNLKTSPLSKFFGTESEVKLNLRNPNNPVFYPKQIRMAAVGLGSSIIANIRPLLDSPQMNHVEYRKQEESLVFHSEVNIRGLSTSRLATTEEIAELLYVVKDFFTTLQEDEDLAPLLKTQDLAELVDNAILFGTSLLAGTGWDPRSALFKENLTSPSQISQFYTQIKVIRTLILSYESFKQPLLAQQISQSLEALQARFAQESLNLRDVFSLMGLEQLINESNNFKYATQNRFNQKAFSAWIQSLIQKHQRQ